MKKAKKAFKKFADVIIVITVFAGVACAQQGNPLWKPIGQDTVSTNRVVKIDNSLEVKEKTTTSIMEVEDYLKVGDSALWFVTFAGVDHIRSDVGLISLMEGTNSTFSSNIKVGIGLTNPNNTLQVKDLINFQPTNSTFIGYLAGNSNSGAGNNFIGYQAGFSNSTGWSNSFFGYQAGFSNLTGGGNNFFGNRAGYTNSTGGANNFFGFLAGFSNSTGGGNNFFGYRAGFSNSTGMQNNFFGNLAGLSNSTGGENNFFGDRAGYTNSTGGGNNFFGYRAGYTNSTGLNNSFFGNRTGFSNISGHSNSFFGNYVGPNNINGSENTFIGSESGFSNTTGNRNLLIGRLADISDGLTNATAIGYRAYVSASDCMVLGAIPGVNGYFGLPAVKVGIGTTAPANILEIAATCTTGTSGLRLSVLAGTSPVNVNVNGVLSVNPLNGDVILVSGGSGGGFGAACTPPTTPFNLADNWRVGLGNYNLYFAGQASNINYAVSSVGIGYDCTDPLFAKFNVLQTKGYNPPTFNNFGYSLAGTFINTTNNIGGGLRSWSILSINTSNAAIDYGIQSYCTGGLLANYGIWCAAAGGFSSNYGIYCYAPANIPPPTAPWINFNYAAFCDGDIYRGGGIYGPSDIRLKDSIQPYTNALSEIRKLYPETFVFKTSEFPSINLPHGKQYGLLAQDVETIFPDLVRITIHPAKYDTLGNMLYDTIQSKSINYDALIPISIQAIKELDSIITYYLPHLPPLPPVLALPQNGATNVELKPLLLSWYKSLNAERYTVEVALDNSFENIVIIAEAFDTVLFTRAEKHNTTYFWRVAALNKKGKSAYSQVFSFTTKPVPGTATLISPENGAVNVPLEAAFMWSNGMPVHKNIIEVALNADFTEMVRQFSTPDSSVTLFLEKDETVHYWRVTTYVFPESSEGAVSETWSFTTQPKGFVMDTVYGTEYRAASDIYFKTNIAAIDNPLDKVLQLNGISYNWRVNDFPQYNFGNSRQLGFNGQEVEQVVPEVVSHDANGYYSVDYGKLVPVLVEAMKVMSARLDALEGSSLQKENGETGETGSTLEKTIKYIELSSKSIVLEQNVPNPFAESTSIDYSVPEDAGFVQIIFTDKAGRIIRAVDIEERGNGQLVVYAQNLSAGMYSYTIVVDGEQIVTRKMIKVTK